jgi:RimJ/RimL family protein N-acetyltransferase
MSSSARSILTERLELLPATAPTLDAALAGRMPLGAALVAQVPASWPPEFLDDDALAFTRERLGEDDAHADWWMYFFLLREAGARVLIGSGGYKGPPAADGTVEIGYGIVGDRRLRGYASEATLGLIARAFAWPRVTRVIGETLPALTGSIAVMRRCGMQSVSGSSEPGVLRFELTRAQHAQRSRAGGEQRVQRV